MMASFSGQRAIAKVLIEAKADINKQDKVAIYYLLYTPHVIMGKFSPTTRMAGLLFTWQLMKAELVL